MVVNIGDVKGVAGDASDYSLTLVPTTMITKMVMKCRYKSLTTIIITSIKDELIPHNVDEKDSRAMWNIL